METTRRNIFRFAAGASAGALFTPAPWKLLDDVSIWSQNWSWIPRPLRGEITDKYTTCTLCPTGCGLRAQCVAGQPYRLVGLGRSLCPAGLGAHQVAYASNRIRHASIHGDNVCLDKAAAVVAERVKAANRIAIVDGRPGRAASDIYREIASSDPKWQHVAAPGSQGLLADLARITGIAYGIDTDKVKTVLSFGAPVLHGWQMPVEFLQRRRNYRLIQIEPVQSRTAAFADVWLAIKPRSEGAFAAAVASVLQGRGVPSNAEQLTGIPAVRVEETARAFANATPSIALAPAEAGTLTSGASAAVASLNLLLGERAALTPRSPAFDLREFEDLADHSVQVLFVDNAAPLPPAVIRRKLAKDATVIALAAFPSEWTATADIVIPTPAWLEAREDAPEAPESPKRTFRLAAAIIKPVVPNAIAAADFIAMAAGLDLTTAQAIDARIAAIHKAGKGQLQKPDGTSAAVSTVSAEDFAAALTEGATWVSGPQPKLAPKSRTPDPEVFARALNSSPAEGLTLAVQSSLPPVPLLGKLWQESALYPAAGIVRMSPVAGLASGSRVEMSNAFGKGHAAVRLDSSLPVGILQADNDAAIRLCGGQGEAWRLTNIDVRSAS